MKEFSDEYSQKVSIEVVKGWSFLFEFDYIFMV